MITNPDGRTPKPVLSPVQLEGVAWLAARRCCYLADEMGAGKTLSLLHSSARRPRGPIVVVCPAVAVGVWRRQITRNAFAFKNAPTDRYTIIADAKWFKAEWHAHDVSPAILVVTYDMVVRHGDKILSRLSNKAPGPPIPPFHLIIDEASALKNQHARRTKAVYKLAQRAQSVAFADGTPMPNGLPSEMYVPLSWAGLLPTIAATDSEPAHVMTYDEMVEEYCTYVDIPLKLLDPDTHKQRIQIVRKETGARADKIEQFKRLIKDFLLERSAKDAAPANMPLPDLLSPEINEVEAGDIDLEILFPLEFYSGVLTATLKEQRDAAGGIVGMARRNLEKNNDPLLPLIALSEHMATYRKYSGCLKAKAVADRVMFGFLQGEYHKTVVFAYHTAVLDLIEKYLGRGVAIRRISGNTPPKKRTEIEDWFQSTTQPCLILSQIKAGGVSITLTEAHKVHMAEGDFVPGVNAQAIKRVHRIGQTKPCQAIWTVLKDDPIDKHLWTTVARKTHDIMRLSLKKDAKIDAIVPADVFTKVDPFQLPF